MINRNLSFSLPRPWEGQTFETRHIGPINYLVGPNGSGKSQFATALLAALRQLPGNPRLLGTDRLSSMARPGALSHYYGNPLGQGYNRDGFGHYRAAGEEGSGIDTIILLEERIALRIQVEATLSHLFNREIILDWDSGRLVPKIQRQGKGESYRLDHEECHGIKELVVLLTHIYDDERQYLVIDEPELNLHPQYQAFFMQEVRKVAGDPAENGKKKALFLITHSPFILDLQSEDDLRAVISFDLEYSVPKQVYGLGLGQTLTASFIRRLNAHHKQLFFSDNPIFVEGIHDARLVEAMMEARGVSVAGAGSCIIDAGGKEEENHYLELCKGLGKEAHFLYDLDSLFRGNLRARIKKDESIQSLLTNAGHGRDLDDYCGTLEQRLTELIDVLLANPVRCPLEPLVDFLRKFGHQRLKWGPQSLPKARTAVMTALSRHREDLIAVVSEEDVEDVEGRLRQIVEVLKATNIHLLPGGTLERYLPCHTGGEYKLDGDAKRRAVDDEVKELSQPLTETELSCRYGELYEAVCSLPSKEDVDVEPVLRNYLRVYIFELQRAVMNNPDWQHDQIQAHLNGIQPALTKVFSIQGFDRQGGCRFTATIEIAEMLGQNKRSVPVDDRTNAGMGEFDIQPTQTADESAQ